MLRVQAGLILLMVILLHAQGVAAIDKNTREAHLTLCHEVRFDRKTNTEHVPLNLTHSCQVKNDVCAQIAQHVESNRWTNISYYYCLPESCSKDGDCPGGLSCESGKCAPSKYHKKRIHNAVFSMGNRGRSVESAVPHLVWCRTKIDLFDKDIKDGCPFPDLFECVKRTDPEIKLVHNPADIEFSYCEPKKCTESCGCPTGVACTAGRCQISDQHKKYLSACKVEQNSIVKRHSPCAEGASCGGADKEEDVEIDSQKYKLFFCEAQCDNKQK